MHTRLAVYTAARRVLLHKRRLARTRSAGWRCGSCAEHQGTGRGTRAAWADHPAAGPSAASRTWMNERASGVRGLGLHALHAHCRRVCASV
eukprot:3136012-Prymnesium_polylepis.2